MHELWRYKDSVLCTPVLHRDGYEATVDAFFKWMRHDPQGAPVLRLWVIRGDGPFAQALADVACRRGLAIHLNSTYSRALARRRVKARPDELLKRPAMAVNRAKRDAKNVVKKLIGRS